ncbi:MAG: hypothetical protein ACP5F0_03610 [Sulfurihydrogenibium sp.]
MLNFLKSKPKDEVKRVSNEEKEKNIKFNLETEVKEIKEEMDLLGFLDKFQNEKIFFDKNSNSAFSQDDFLQFIEKMQKIQDLNLLDNDLSKEQLWELASFAEKLKEVLQQKENNKEKTNTAKDKEENLEILKFISNLNLEENNNSIKNDTDKPLEILKFIQKVKEEPLEHKTEEVLEILNFISKVKNEISNLDKEKPNEEPEEDIIKFISKLQSETLKNENTEEKQSKEKQDKWDILEFLGNTSEVEDIFTSHLQNVRKELIPEKHVDNDDFQKQKYIINIYNNFKNLNWYTS